MSAALHFIRQAIVFHARFSWKREFLRENVGRSRIGKDVTAIRLDGAHGIVRALPELENVTLNYEACDRP